MKIVTSLENRLPEIQAVLTDVATSGQYAEGRYCEAVREELGMLWCKHVVLTNSCGSALYTVFKYLRGIGHKQALVQNNTFYATGAAVAEAGLGVALVDSRPDCPSMSVSSLKDAWAASGATVVVLTHVGGWVAKDYEDIAEFCRSEGLVLVEDCAHALGVIGAGTLGYASCWSFYPTKALPCGEGGAISAMDEKLLRFARDYVNYGKTVKDGVMTYTRGLNFRMSEWDAAVLSVQLKYRAAIVSARTRDAQKLQQIVPCLLSGDSNYYKYPVAVELANGLKRVGKVYARTDQLLTSLWDYGTATHVPLVNSMDWAIGHVCLPMGEGLYDNMSTDEVRALLKV